MDEINAVSSEQVAELRSNFHEKVISKSPDFHPKDIERVKTDDLWLRRFIAHWEYDLEAALTMLYDCCQWRKEFGTNDLDETHFQEELLDQGTLFIRNTDKWGKMLLVFKGKTHQKGSIEMETMQKLVVYFFERIERESNSDQISIIFDMKDTGWNNMDMDFVRYLITLLKTYYPYFVNYLIIYEMPWLLNAAWRIIRTWLSEKFASRVKLLKRDTLKDYIDPSNQLTEWGGTDNYVYKFEPELRRKKGARGSPPTHVTNGNVLPSQARPRKLHFSEVNHHQSADICASTSPITPLLPSLSETANSLAEVQDRLTFKPSDGETEELCAELKIRNVSSLTLAIKIKTTSPEKYRVKPIICIVTRNSEAIVNISTHQGVSVCSLTRDRFQVQVTEVPQTTTVETPDLGSLFKSIVAAGAVVETYRVGVSPEVRLGDTGTGTPSISLNDERLRRGLEDLERRIAESVSEKLAVHNAKLEKQCLMGMGVVLLLFVVILLYLFSLSRNFYPVDCRKVCEGIIGSGNWASSSATTSGSCPTS